MKHVFIVNKISGKGTAYKNVPTIKKVCEKKNLDYVIEITEYEGHAKEIAKKYNGKKDIILYSVGGDGTFLELIDSMNPNLTLGILPCGSGNDYYRYFGGVNTNYEQLIEDTINIDPIFVDVGQNNYMKFANTTSLGIDAKINLDASHLIRKTIFTKGIAYIMSIISNIITLKSCNVKMIVDGKDYSDEYYIIACMNGKYYGNGVKAAPIADLTDGYFDLVLFKKANRLKVYSALSKYLSGKATEKDGVRIIKCKDIIIDSDEDMACQSDGENYMTRHLECHMIHNYIKLKVSK